VDSAGAKLADLKISDPPFPEFQLLLADSD
jgi:hypothetical protein